MAVEANLDAVLDKAYENKPLREVLSAPVSALAGVTDKDGELLKQALNIKTVQDLGKNKFFRAAYALVLLSESGAK